jgi:hypothetical protein
MTRLTISDMQAYASDLHARCKPREGYQSGGAQLMLSADDVAALEAIARFLELVAPHRNEIAKLVEGKRS